MYLSILVSFFLCAGTGLFVEPQEEVLLNNSLTSANTMLHCVTGFRSTNVGRLIGLLGEEVTGVNGSTILSRGVGTLHVGGLQHMNAGVYTCRIPDETGAEVDMHVGIYPPEKASKSHTQISVLLLKEL